MDNINSEQLEKLYNQWKEENEIQIKNEPTIWLNGVLNDLSKNAKRGKRQVVRRGDILERYPYLEDELKKRGITVDHGKNLYEIRF